MIALPTTPTANERVLAGFRVEALSGLTGPTVTLAQVPQADTVQVVKNGATLVPSGTTNGWTLDAQTLTLTEDLIAADTLAVSYWPRTGGG